MLGGATLGDILDSKQDGRVVVVVVEDLSSIEQHDPSTNYRKILLDLVFLHDAVLRHDPLKAVSQIRNIPLAVTQGSEQLPLVCLGLTANVL
jgi:hypothetical protein